MNFSSLTFRFKYDTMLYNVLTSQIQYGTRVLGGLQCGTHVLVVSWAEMVSWPKSHPNRIFDLVHLLLACIYRRDDSKTERYEFR